METIGFIGLGNIGSRIARDIQQAGFPLVVHDIREAATAPFLEDGARLAGSGAEVARLTDVTFTSLPGPKEVEEVAIGPQGILQGIKEGAVYVDLSTRRPSLIRRLEPMFRKKGASVLETPVLAGPAGISRSCGAVLIGGEPEVYARLKPILATFGDNLIYAGGLGSATIAKLVHNMIGHGVRQTIVEAFTMGVKAGVDPLVLWEALRRGGRGRGRDFQETMARALRGQFESGGFTLTLSRKDLGLATELAREYDVPMPVTNMAEQIAIQAINRGWGEKGAAVTFLLQEEAAGVEIRNPEADVTKTPGFITVQPEAE